MVVAVLAVAFADDGTTWLQRIDDAVRVKDSHSVLRITAYDKAGAGAERVLETWQLGTEMRLIKYQEPARLEGVGLLIPERGTIHLYLPAYGKPRRVVGEQRSDSFMGTDFSVEDLSRLSFSEDYTAVVEGAEADGTTRLALTPREGVEGDPLRIWAGTDAIVRKIEHLGADGTVERRMVLSDVRPVGKILVAHHAEVDDLEKGTRTVADITSVEIDTGLSRDLFTVTNLAR